MSPNLIFFCCVLLVGVTGSVAANKLTIVAALTGGVLGVAIFAGLGWTGIALLATFFLLGTLATSYKKNVKQALGLVEENKGRRNAGQVLANAGAAGLLGLLAVLFPNAAPVFILLAAASLSSATADTVSSEMGSVHGKKFYDVLTFRKGTRGADGVVSVEGTLLGMGGSCLVAAVYSACVALNATFLWIVLAGTAGNLADSYLGATLERKGIIGNDAVNLLNTVTAVAVVLLLRWITPGY